MKKYLLPLSAGLVATAMSIAAAADDAPRLSRVVLTTGGVAYLEHDIALSGNPDVALPVGKDQIDDVLKSIVLYDSAPAPAPQIRLPGATPLRQIFGRLPISAAALSDTVTLLRQLQGMEVTIDGPQQMTGRLINIVRREEFLPQSGRILPKHVISLLTATGLQQVLLEEARGIGFSDPQLQAQLQDALKAVAENKEHARKTLTLSLPGREGRRLKIGYVVAAPIWKTTYKITLPAENAGKAESAQDKGQLQGWALVENMTGGDWNNVDLTLTSGQPVTFRQSLYAPYYVSRPIVPISVGDRPLPPPDQGATAVTSQQVERERPPASPGLQDRASLRARNFAAPMAKLSAADAAAAVEESAGHGGSQAGAAAAAGTGAVHFKLTAPVSVAAGESLMVPILTTPLAGKLVAMYNAGIHSRHPMLSLALTNEETTDLPSGSVALYRQVNNESQFVGDAQLLTLPAGESRYLRFATETGILVQSERRNESNLVRGRLSNGILTILHQDRLTTRYKIRRATDRDTVLVIEHPKRPGWTLKKEAFEKIEETDTHFRLTPKPEQTAAKDSEITVTQSRTRSEKVQLLSGNNDRLAFFARSQQLSPALRQALTKLASLQAAVNAAERALQQSDIELQEIYGDQSRLRDNLASVPENSDLARRYLSKLQSQEDELDRLTADVNQQQETLARNKQAVRSYLNSLDLRE